jgi:hypothetical protein
MPIVPSIEGRELEGRLQSQASLGKKKKKKNMRPYPKNNLSQKRTGGIAKVDNSACLGRARL